MVGLPPTPCTLREAGLVVRAVELVDLLVERPDHLRERQRVVLTSSCPAEVRKKVSISDPSE
jgi:hypothetical protein